MVSCSGNSAPHAAQMRAQLCLLRGLESFRFLPLRLLITYMIRRMSYQFGMATESTLALRRIRPHIRASAHTINPWRRETKEFAKANGISRRRAVRILTKKAR